MNFCAVRAVMAKRFFTDPSGHEIKKVDLYGKTVRMRGIVRGLTNNQIAMQFEISPESVKTHIAKLFEKIGAASRSEAVSIALRKQLLKI